MAESGPEPGSEGGSAARASRLTGLLAELKRRGVTRALVGYAVAAFAVLQVAEPILHALRLPDGWLTGVVVLLALGFPVVAAVSWAYDLTSHGLVRTDKPEPQAPGTPPPPRAWRGTLAAVVLASAALGAGLAWWALRPAAIPVDADGRIVVAVADFANETRDPDLDGLSELLITSLEQSRRLRVLTRSRMSDVLKQLGRSGIARIDESLAREVGRREGVRALLHGSVRRLGETYAVDLRGLDPMGDRYLLAVREQAGSKEGLLGVIDRLAEQTRLALQEPGAEVHAAGAKVAEVATPNLEAWRHYVEGLRHEDIGRLEAAVDEYHTAVKLDPEFSLAWFRIAFRGEWTAVGDPERRAAIEAALSGAARLPEKERLLIQAWKARLEGRKDEALALAARAAERSPRDKESAFMAGILAWDSRGPGEALSWFERAQALDPTWDASRSGVINGLAGVGRRDEAVQRAQAWVAQGPDVASIRLLTEALQNAGRVAEGAAAARRILELDGSPVARAWVASALLRADRPEEAEALVRPYAKAGAAVEIRDALADALAAQGRRRAALEVIGWEPVPGARGWSRYVLLMGDRDPAPALREARELLRTEVYAQALITGAIYLGDMALAAEAARHLTAGPSLRRGLYEALLEWKAGRGDEALSRLRDLERTHQLNQTFHWWHARIALEQGHLDEADRARVAFESLYSGAWRGWGRAQLLLYVAEAHARRGDRVKALQALDRLEALWAKADRDLPQLEDARALRRRLATAGPQRPEATP